MMAWNLRKRVTFRPVSGSEKKFEEAIRERNSGDRPNIAMLALEATPRYFGNVLDAENNEENSLSNGVNGGLIIKHLFYSREYCSKTSHEEKERKIVEGGSRWLCDIVGRLGYLKREEPKSE